MKYLDLVAGILLIVGGLNWGLVGLLEINLVSTLFSAVPFLERIIYILVGVSAIYEAINWKRICAC